MKHGCTPSVQVAGQNSPQKGLRMCKFLGTIPGPDGTLREPCNDERVLRSQRETFCLHPSSRLLRKAALKTALTKCKPAQLPAPAWRSSFFPIRSSRSGSADSRGAPKSGCSMANSRLRVRTVVVCSGVEFTSASANSPRLGCAQHLFPYLNGRFAQVRNE